MQFSDSFSRIMDEYGISGYELSKATGISDSLISSWKRGVKKPSLDNLLKLADYFDVSLDYLVGREERDE